MFPKWFAAIKIAGELLKLAIQFPSLLREIRRDEKKYQNQVKEQQKRNKKS